MIFPAVKLIRSFPIGFFMDLFHDFPMIFLSFPHGKSWKILHAAPQWDLLQKPAATLPVANAGHIEGDEVQIQHVVPEASDFRVELVGDILINYRKILELLIIRHDPPQKIWIK